jgi:transposase
VRCACGHRFDGSEERVGDPLLRQKWELPEVVPLVIEHRLRRLLCPECGTGVLGEGDGISGSAFGPRLEAHIAVMAGVYRLSRRQIVELLSEMFGCPIRGYCQMLCMSDDKMIRRRPLRSAVRHRGCRRQ